MGLRELSEIPELNIFFSIYIYITLTSIIQRGERNAEKKGVAEELKKQPICKNMQLENEGKKKI